MIDALVITVMLSLGAAALWALVEVLRNRSVNLPLLIGCAVLELLLLVQVVAGVIRLAGSDREVPAVTFLAYQFGSLLVLPAGVLWGLAERTRYGPAVLVVACLSLVVMVARMQQLWSAAG